MLAAVSVVVLMYEGRHFAFQNDEWDWMLHRRGHSLSVFLKPHNEHLSAIPIFIYKLFFQVFGASSTAPYRLVVALLAAISAALLFVLVARRFGGWVALVPAAVLLFFGPGWNDTLWGFQMGYLGSLAAGLGTFFLLERDDRLGDVGATVLLIIGLLCSSVGLTVLIGAAVEIAVVTRLRRWRRLWVVALPAVLYVIWYSHYGVSAIRLSNIDNVPLYAFQGFAAVAGSLVGLTQPAAGSPYGVTIDPGTAIAVVLLLAFCVRFIRGGALPARFWGMAATAVAFWGAAALSYVEGRDPTSSRYVFVLAFFVVLAIAECCLGLRTNRRAGVVMGVVALAAIVSNLGFLKDGAALFNQTSQYARAELGAMDVAQPVVSPAFLPESPAISSVIGIHNMIPIDARSYFSATKAFGSQADDVRTILRQPVNVREAADFVLVKAENLAYTPARLPKADCTRHQPIGGGVELTTGPGTMVLDSTGGGASNVAIRRLSSQYLYAALGPLTPRVPVAVSFPRDLSLLPWHLRVMTSSPVLVCTAR